MTMNEMLAFGIEINTCGCVGAYVRVRAPTHVPVLCLLACSRTVSEATIHSSLGCRSEEGGNDFSPFAFCTREFCTMYMHYLLKNK